MTLITYDIVGLPKGKHGLHVHEMADFTNGCLSTGNHFNPYLDNHASATDWTKHLGDLGNILADENDRATGTNLLANVPLTGTNSIIGRSIVVHAGEDDLGQGGDD